MKFFASPLLLAVLLVLPTRLPAESASPTPSGPPSSNEAQPDNKEEAAPGEEKKSQPEEFDIPVPIGRPVKGLKVPQYDEDGNLQFLFEAEVARKIDETHIAMENLKIDAYADDGKKFYIEMPTADFNLETRILTGDEKVHIQREDFDILGDAGEFHTKTRFAKIIGNVKMTIFTEKFDNP